MNMESFENTTKVARKGNSPADMCKVWENRAHCEESTKFGTDVA